MLDIYANVSPLYSCLDKPFALFDKVVMAAFLEDNILTIVE